MPKLNQMSWQVYRKPATNGSSVAVPAMLLSLVLGEGPGKAAREVNVEMSKEQLEAMLASLSKVKEQARALGASHSIARADCHSVARVVSPSCVPLLSLSSCLACFAARQRLERPDTIHQRRREVPLRCTEAGSER